MGKAAGRWVVFVNEILRSFSENVYKVLYTMCVFVMAFEIRLGDILLSLIVQQDSRHNCVPMLATCTKCTSNIPIINRFVL